MTTEDKIMRDIHWLSSYGSEKNQGMTRLLYSKSWKAAQEAIREKMISLGFISQYDAVGNLFTTFEGKDKNKVILCGSHIDTVVNGGNLDGQYGILAGLLSMQMLKEKYGQPKKTIQIVSVAEEEGSRFPFAFWGSKNIVGCIKPKIVQDLLDCEGIRFENAMREAGFDYKTKPHPIENIEAFVELHIEQGAVLEREKCSIGVVQSIVGQKRFKISIEGQANHAGTTPMSYRKDSVYCSAKIIIKIMEEAQKWGDPMVATVGQMELLPNTPNVIPGNTRFTLDIRHSSKSDLDYFEEKIHQITEALTKQMGIRGEVVCYEQTCPAPMSLMIIERTERICKKQNITYRKMTSGAGHDAQIFASHHIPTGMIFVPSVGGISHSKEEYTQPKDLVLGVEMLMELLYELAY